ncbi:hypothetical protein [uncultured Roseobacter sp.]|uniref:hypothetical protein n=1 Tax=uncultured Roseobacter sp. TaxID=114847 RepID=UPI0026208943|nr:hypothetical protein [uncultured Roseobacter sp.]
MKRLLCMMICAGLPAGADVTYPGGKTVDCYCTDRSGARIELGETICLQVDGRMFMAQCQMSLNVPMWREVEQGCLSSSLRGADHPLQSRAVYPQI